MYEHVICINPLNLTLRSSTPDFFTRLGFEGTLVFWNCALPSEGKGGATQASPVLWHGKHSSLAPQVWLGRNAPKKAKKQFYQLVILWRHKPDYQYNLSPFKTGETLLTFSISIAMTMHFGSGISRYARKCQKSLTSFERRQVVLVIWLMPSEDYKLIKLLFSIFRSVPAQPDLRG